ncbi:MAG: hypothetical protein PVH88_12240 [Ignavibacteria bacterium]|jgi:hypothetical protein
MDRDQLQEDITFIKNMIENNRRLLVDNGIAYISIGVYIVIGVTISYFLEINGKTNFVTPLWLLLMAFLIVFNYMAQKRIKRKQTRKTFASEIFNATWIACAIPITVVSVLYFIIDAISTSSLFVVVSTILGIGYYLTGIINELKFMKYLAFGWWLGSVTAISWKYIGEEYQLSLLFAMLIFILEVVPGIIIYRKWKRIYNE